MDCYRYQNMLCVRRNTQQTYFINILKEKGYWFSSEKFKYTSENDSIVVFFNTSKLQPDMIPVTPETLDITGEIPVGYIVLLQENFTLKVDKMCFTDLSKFTECMHMFNSLIIQSIQLAFTAEQIYNVNLNLVWNKYYAGMCYPILKLVGLVELVEDTQEVESYTKIYNKNNLNPSEFSNNPNSNYHALFNKNTQSVSQLQQNQLQQNQLQPSQLQQSQLQQNQLQQNQPYPQQVQKSQLQPSQLQPSQLSTSHYQPSNFYTQQQSSSQQNPHIFGAPTQNTEHTTQHTSQHTSQHTQNLQQNPSNFSFQSSSLQNPFPSASNNFQFKLGSTNGGNGSSGSTNPYSFYSGISRPFGGGGKK